MPPVCNQGDLGCCTAAATSAAYVYVDMLKGKPAWNPSLIFLYYNTRAIEGAVHVDRGAQIRNALKASAEFGLCREELAPFEPDKFAVTPAPAAFGDATTHQALVYERCPLDRLRYCLASKLPVIFGATIYENFEELDDTAAVSMPKGSVLGGHAMLIVGYNDMLRQFTVRNSWGDSWGDRGHCYMPYEYFNENLVADAWSIHDTEL